MFQRLPEPGVFGGETLFAAHRRRKSQLGTRPLGVGVGMPHIALLILFDGNDRLSAGHPANYFKHVVDGDPRPASNILHTPRSSPRCRGYSGLDGVLDEGEIARLLTIAKYGNGLSQQSCLKEFVKAHVGPLPWA